MEMKLIETALVLIAMYLLLGLIVTQLGELYAGMMGTRRDNLTDMIYEAFAGHQLLIKKFYEFGPIYSLSKGSKTPSAIPPDLFASSYLAVLNDGIPPRSRFQTPSEFVNAENGYPEKMKQVLTTMVAGVEADWAAFESRVALWFSDIGDRADGWYKRRSTLRILIIATIISFVSNADSAFIARSMIENDTLRGSFANLAELLVPNGVPGANQITKDAASVLTEPTDGERLLLAASELSKARAALRDAAGFDKSLIGVGDNRGTTLQMCADGLTRTKIYDSNFDAWLIMLPALQQQVKRAGLQLGPKDGDTVPLLSNDKREESIRTLMTCISTMQAYVDAARRPTTDDRASAKLKEATAAFDSSLSNMSVVLRNVGNLSSFSRSYATLGPAFRDCAIESGEARAAFDRCLSSASAITIPFGWPARTGQFCDISPSDPDGLATKRERQNGALSHFFGCEDFSGSKKLKIAPIYADASISKSLGAVCGILFTAVMISLGAPFWFGILGKVANIRIAGRVRRVNEDSVKGSPHPLLESDGKGRPLPLSNDVSPRIPFDRARNEFESGLRPQEISRLQKALDRPPTGVLDQVTRNAIAARLISLGEAGDEELGPVTYETIVGRRAAFQGLQIATSGTWDRSTQGSSELIKLGIAFDSLFPSPLWPAIGDRTSFTDEMRARTVLFRLKSETAVDLQDHPVVEMARRRNGELTRLDESLRLRILKSADANIKFPRENPAWLDFALGELGISEDGRPSQSNPRVVEYFDALSASAVEGDDTPWCGAFVGWVMAKAGMLTAKNYTDSFAKLLSAKEWSQFGSAVNPALPGDIVVIKRDSRYHVAFFIASNKDRTIYFLLGGNQGPTGSGAVTLIPFRIGDSNYSVQCIQRPTY